MHKNLSRLLVLTLAVALAAVVVAPGATAQQVTPKFSLTDALPDKSTLAPDIDIGRVTVKGIVSYSEPGAVAGPAVIPSAQAVFQPPTCDRTGVSISGPLTIPIDQSGAGPSKSSFPVEAKFTITANLLAPGETDIVCTFKAKVTSIQSSAFKETPDALITMPIKVKFLGLLSASVPATIIEAGPQKEIPYQIELTNLGNSLTNVNFNLVGEVPEGWSVVPPTPIIMQSQQQGGTEFTKTVNFQVQTSYSNGWNNGQQAFQLKILPSSTKDPSLVGNEIAINVLARVRGIYVPGPEPLLLVGAVIGTALVARLMRRDE